jgi:hypothetical protein
MADLSIPLQGMQTALSAFDRTAGRIANAPGSAQSFTSSQGDRVDLSTEAVNLLTERDAYEANTKTAMVMNDMAQATLDILK